MSVYVRMRQQSVLSFCDLIEKHPHFNYRLNILQSVMPRLASGDTIERKRVTDLVVYLLGHYDQGLLEFKVDILKELNNVVKTKNHQNMEPNLLDCLVLHTIIVDEDKAKAIAESATRSKDLHERMNKLRRKGKLKEYKEIKLEMLNEVK